MKVNTAEVEARRTALIDTLEQEEKQHGGYHGVETWRMAAMRPSIGSY